MCIYDEYYKSTYYIYIDTVPYIDTTAIETRAAAVKNMDNIQGKGPRETCHLRSFRRVCGHDSTCHVGATL